MLEGGEGGEANQVSLKEKSPSGRIESWQNDKKDGKGAGETIWGNRGNIEKAKRGFPNRIYLSTSSFLAPFVASFYHTSPRDIIIVGVISSCDDVLYLLNGVSDLSAREDVAKLAYEWNPKTEGAGNTAKSSTEIAHKRRGNKI